MKNYKLISAIIGEPWLISPQYAQNQLSLISSLLEGRIQFDQDASEADANPLVVMRTVGATALIGINKYTDFSRIPEDSIAVINIVGPVTKYEVACGGPTGSITAGALTLQAAANKNIKSIVFLIDTPGGQVAGTKELASIIKAVDKPTIALVSDMMASAGMWIGSACDEIYAENTLTEVGSIGVYSAFVDQRGKYAKEGSVVHEIYAPQSTEKNKDYRDAISGDTKLMESKLAFIADEFISVVKANRGDKLNLKAGDPFKGAMYYAEEATKIGLIDGIKSFSEVIAHVEQLSSANNSAQASVGASESSQPNTHTPMKKIAVAFTTLIAFLSFNVAAGATESTEELTDDKLKAINDEMSRLQGVEASFTALSTEAETLRTNATTASDALTAVTAERDEWKTKAEAYGAKAGATPTTPVKTGTDKVEGAADAADFIDKAASHNAGAAEFFGKL